ncbi:cyclohexanone 1,2-monooxygenase [Phlyctema vagabunda]|uniref:Cyclohexanone 1,2-monooxygenase n=1 Tax=Phlyctema vagabunda TaxID=108571 RepID=A0ABR4PHU2_9HELO
MGVETSQLEIPPSTSLFINEQPALTPRRLRIVCVGAGYSGLTLAHKIKYQYSDLPIDFVIYEKNDEVGGTWLKNQYPGVACDIPAHCYTFSFEPNPDWSRFFVSGAELLAYIKRTVKKYRLDEEIIFNTRVRETIWNESLGKWEIEVDRGGRWITDTADILVNASGIHNRWEWPDIPGLSEFRGKIMHTAAWDKSYNLKGKKVAVIGNGSSAIQLVTAIQPQVSRLVSYARHPTWISVNLCPELTDNGKNFAYTQEQKLLLRNNPEKMLELRKDLENSVNRIYWAMIRGSPANKGLAAFIRQNMAIRLKNDPHLAAYITPAFNPGCRRLTPGDGYLEALQARNVTSIWDPIISISEEGIKTANDEEDFDLIICATGFDDSNVPGWRMVGKNGWEQTKENYNNEAFLGLNVEHLPNYFILGGPNFPTSVGNAMSAYTFASDYIMRWTKKMATEDIKSFVVKKESVDDYNEYSQELLKRTVWSDRCDAWFRDGQEDGKVTAIYAGSSCHYKDMLENVGSEHFDWTWRSKNRFRFMGNGESIRDEGGRGDLAYYMREARFGGPGT